MNQNDVVYVPVPSQWLSDVYALLGALGSGSVPVRAGVETDSGPDGELIRRMYVESESEQRRLMRLMADSPDAWRYSKELAQDLGLLHGARGLAGMFGAFGRRAKHRYGGQKPWESRWDAAREENRYRMTADNAAIIAETAASLSSD
jgi:hypothetical protein